MQYKSNRDGEGLELVVARVFPCEYYTSASHQLNNVLLRGRGTGVGCKVNRPELHHTVLTTEIGVIACVHEY